MARPIPIHHRPQLIGPVGLVLLALALAVPLLLVLQNPASLTGYIQSRSPDAVSIRYLELMVQMKPQDQELRLALIDQMLTVGQIDRASQQLDQLQTGATESTDIRRLRTRVDYLRYTSLPEGDPQREALRQRLLKRLESGVPQPLSQLDTDPNLLDVVLQVLIPAANAAEEKLPAPASEAMSLQELKENAEMSLAVNRPDLAAAYYLGMAKKDSDNAIKWYREAARWFVASGKGHEAGLALHEASLHASTSDEAASLSREAMAAFQSASDFDTALATAKADIERFPDDQELLSSAVDLALAANRPAMAKTWATRLTALAGSDPAALKRQLEIELAAQDLKSAVNTAMALTATDPNDVGYRKKLAEVATWAKRPEIALNQQLWLIQHGSEGANVDTALGLAVATRNDQAWMQLMESQAGSRPLQGQQLNDALAIYKRSRQAGRLESLLSRQVSAHPEQRPLWHALAQAQRQNGKPQQSAQTWAQIRQRFGASEESLIGEAEALQDAKQTAPALALLKAHQDKMAPTSVKYWRMLAQLAGKSQDHATAAHAYQVVQDTPQGTTADAEGLIASHLALGQIDQALAASERAAERYRQDRFLLQALQVALQEGRWSALGKLLPAAEKTQLPQAEPYWLVRAEYARHAESPAQMADSYRQALKLNSGSVPARTGLLWALIAQKDRNGLNETLPRWESEAKTDPAYWAAYATGYKLAGRSGEALSWYERQAKAKPEDYLWKLGYADALDDAGKAKQAIAMRRQVLDRLQAERRQGKRWPDPAVKLAYANLLGEFAPAEEAAFVGELNADANTDPAIREHLVGYYLNQKSYRQARHWMDVAEQQKQELPAWQRLSMAMAEHDDDTIRGLVEHSGNSLDPVSRVEGWKKLGENRKALAVARTALQDKPDDKTATTLKAQAADLTALTANKLNLGWRAERMGQFGMDEYRAGIDLPQDRYTLGFSVAQRALSFKGPELNVAGFRNESELLASFLWPYHDDARFDAKLGANIRDDHTLFLAKLGWTQTFDNWITARFEGAYNQMAYETGFLRAVGVKHHVSAEAVAQFDDRNSARVKFELHHFASRNQDFLGRGYAIEAEVGHTLHQEWPFWRMKAQGGWTQNQLAEHVPGELFRQGLASNAVVSSLVPREYGMAGVGTHVRWGKYNGPNVGIEAWAGYIAPAQDLAYNVRMSAGTPVFTDTDRFSVEGFHASAQTGLVSQPYETIGVNYLLPF